MSVMTPLVKHGVSLKDLAGINLTGKQVVSFINYALKISNPFNLFNFSGNSLSIKLNKMFAMSQKKCVFETIVVVMKVKMSR